MPNTNRGNTTPTGPLVRTAHPNNKGMNMGSPFSSIYLPIDIAGKAL